MPLPINSIRGIQFSLRNIPKDISEAEKQRLIALTAINYVGSLGRAVSFLSASKLCHSEGIPLDKSNDHLEDLDSAVFVIGDLQACLMDTAYGAVEEMFTALTESSKADSRFSQEDSGSPPIVETKPRRLTKPGRVKASAA